MFTFRDSDLSRKINKMKRKKKETNRNFSCVLAVIVNSRVIGIGNAGMPPNQRISHDSLAHPIHNVSRRTFGFRIFFFFDSTEWNTAPECYLRVCVCVRTRFLHGLNGANRQSALAPNDK